MLICDVLFGEISVHIFCPFSDWIEFFFLLLSYESSLCILGVRSSLDVWPVCALSQSEACHFSLLAVFFRAKVLNFNEIQFCKFFLPRPCIWCQV